MKTVSDIMISNVISVNTSDSIHHARMILKDKGIRHLPVVDDNNHYIGLLTQRSLLNHAINIVEKFGLSGLEKREKRTPVKEIMTVDGITVKPDTGLTSTGELFITKKVSCLPVVKENQLQGIVTSVDFVKLALHLLQK